MADSGVTKEYLESFLKEPIEKFEVRSGSNLGDGYTCALYTVDVWKTSDPDNPLSLLIKCFPANASRQELLDQGGSFRVELRTYDTVIPELIKFQEEMGVEVIYPPVPKFIYGQYIPPEERKNSANPLTPLDNCIVMPDLREKSNGAFRLRDRFLGFDYDHYKLVIEAHATLHALSWAYKCKRGITDFEKEFPFLKVDFEPLIKVMQPFMEMGFTQAKETLKESPEAVAAVEYLRSVNESVGGLYWDFDYGQKERGHTKDNVVRNPGPVIANEEPWVVLLHGDAWSNNMMFRYDEKTNKPVEVLLIDLQMCRQGDPFCDINYTLFASGAPGLREKHLTSLLHVYFDTFSGICEKLHVPTLPGWSWEEFNRRMQRAKIFGGNLAVMGLPLMLKNLDELSNLDHVAAAVEGKDNKASALENASEFFSGLVVTKKPNAILKTRMLAVMHDLIRDGIL